MAFARNVLEMMESLKSSDTDVNIEKTTLLQETDLLSMVKNVILEGNMNFNTIAELKEEVTFLKNELENKNNQYDVGKRNIETTASNSVEPKSYLSDVSTNGKLYEIIDE